MTQWFISYGGNQSGPFDLTEAQRQAQANPNGHAWREGLSDWQPITQISELGVSVPTPSPPPSGVGGADLIDYKIIGQEMQGIVTLIVLGRKGPHGFPFRRPHSHFPIH